MTRYVSLKYRIVATLIALETIMVGFVLWQTTSAAMNAARAKQAAFEETVIVPLREQARIALLTDDFTDLQNYIFSFANVMDEAQVMVARSDGRVVASANITDIGKPLPPLNNNTEAYWRREAIQNESGTLGSVAVQFQATSLSRASRDALVGGLAIAAVGLAVLALVTILMIHVLTRRLEQLRAAALRIAQGEFAVRAAVSGNDEISELGHAFDAMASEVQKQVVRLTKSEERFALAVSGANDGIWDWNIAEDRAFFSPAFLRLLGFDEATAEATSLSFWKERIHREDYRNVVHALDQYLGGHGEFFSSEHRLCTKSGRYIWVHMRGRAIRNTAGTPIRMAGSLTDVTERRHFQELIQHQAMHDPLTDLPNRALLLDRLNQLLRRAMRNHEQFAVMIIDLDRFKEINDTLGHSTGDLVLRRLADRIRELMRSSDTLSRVGGDEFVLLLSDASHDSIGTIVERLRTAVEAPIDAGSHRLHLEASFGAAFYPTDGNDVETLLRRADIAMYQAKHGGAGFAVYQSDQDTSNAARLNMITELHDAIRLEQLVLHYQPKLDLLSGRIAGAEALVRWQHPARGLVPPAEFVPLAESSGLIHAMTHWVLERAVKTHHAWREAGIECAIAVNISTRVLLDADLPRRIQRLLAEWRVDPMWLQLEITESAIMTDPRTALSVLEKLDAMGVQMAVDDYGTGYSSLAYLRDLPVRELKIDRSFVRNMLNDNGSLSIVRSTIDLGHSLGLSVVAEGVETADILNELRALGCDLAQGYFISRPVAEEALLVLLQNDRASAPPAPPLASAS